MKSISSLLSRTSWRTRLTTIGQEPIAQMAGLATILVGLSFVLQGHIGLNLSDEGFLWYGTWRTALGEIPVRDFQSYDPARYFWGAFWFHVLQDQGIMALRFSAALFQALGLTCGLLTVRKLTRSPWLLVSGGFILLLWMLPRHKVFESSIALMAVYFAVLLVEKPTLRQHFISGFFVGFAAFWGRQHGLYTAVSFFLLILFVWLKFKPQKLVRSYLAWGSGIFLGYSPVILMFILFPGFWESLINLTLDIFRNRTTNLPLTVPFPWNVNFQGLSLLMVMHHISVGIFFLLLPLFNGISLIYILLQRPNHLRQNPVLIAATFLSLTYTHYAFSRADFAHLAQGIDPMLLGLMATTKEISCGKPQLLRRFWLFNLAWFSILSAGVANPYMAWRLSPPAMYVDYTLPNSHDNLKLLYFNAKFIDTVDNFVKIHLDSDELIFLAPHVPTLYPILRRPSPLWYIYMIYPDSDEIQYDTIHKLNYMQVNYVLLGDIALDGRDELRFKNTHPIIWEYLSQEFVQVETPNLPPNYHFYRRRK